MKAIWKFPLTPSERQRVLMPDGAKIIEVAPQDRTICVWAIVETSGNTALKEREIVLVGTGHEIPDLPEGSEHLGTVHVSGYVFHVFGVRG